MPENQDKNIVIIHGMTRGARNGFILMGIIFIIVNLALFAGEIRFQNTTNSFNTLQHGVCTLVDKSNKDTLQTKTLLESQAQRALIRYRVDKAAGNITAAEADLDARRIDLRFAKQSSPIDRNIFGC